MQNDRNNEDEKKEEKMFPDPLPLVEKGKYLNIESNTHKFILVKE